MLRRLLNEMTIHVEAMGHSPLLIKDGRFIKSDWFPEKSDPAKKAADNIFVSRNRLREEVVKAAEDPTQGANLKWYIPGASVRGSWRSHLEERLRSLNPDKPTVCDPLLGKEETDPNRKVWESCSTVLVREENPRPKKAYKGSCPVCRLFGSTAQASRISFSDGQVTAGRGELVDNVAINRFTGAVISPFKSLALVDAAFTLDLRLENFELWQAGLLAILFGDLREKRVPLGFGKNKGWGEISAGATRIEVAYYGSMDRGADGKLRGIGELMSAEDLQFYGVTPGTPPAVALTANASGNSPWRHSWVANGTEAARAFWSAVEPAFQPGWKPLPDLSTRARRAEA